MVSPLSQEQGILEKKSSINIFSYQKNYNDCQKLLDACQAFACEPWIAIYVGSSESADVYLTSLKNYDEKYRGREGKAIEDWKMGKKSREEYEKDPDVKYIGIEFQAANWDWNQ